MKVSTFVKKYAAKNTTPDPQYCTDLIMYWELKSGVIHYNPTKGILGDKNLKGDVYRTPSTYGYDSNYAKCIREDIIELAHIHLDNGKRGKDGEVRTWEYKGILPFYPLKRVFLDRTSLQAYDEQGNLLWQDANAKYYNKRVAELLQKFSSYIVFNHKTVIEMKKWSGYNPQYQYMWSFVEWYKYAMPRKKTSETEKIIRIGELLPEVEHTENAIDFYIKENYGIFRLYRRKKETVRVFISEKGKVTIMKRYDDDRWELKPIMGTDRYGWSWNLLGVPEITYHDDPKEITCLKYIWDLRKLELNKTNELIDSMKTVISIIDMLRHPIIEKLIKSGYKNIANAIMSDGNIKNNAMNYFAIDKLNEKQPLYKATQTNKQILEYIENDILNHNYAITYVLRFLKIMRDVFQDKLLSLSYDKFNRYAFVVDIIAQSWSSPNYQLDYTCARYSNYRKNTPLTENTIEAIHTLAKIDNIHVSPAVNAYKDTVNLYRNLEDKPEINFKKLNTIDKINRAHDNLMQLSNILAAQRREKELEKYKEEFKKLQKQRRDDFECIGDTYSILIPENLIDITEEGLNLNHCVNTYLERHAKGYTNILFLRKNDERKKSFYTIEVHDNRVIQIHGKNNKWLGNDPEAISFVYNWIKERELMCDKDILLNKATGYCGSKEHVSEQYLCA